MPRRKRSAAPPEPEASRTPPQDEGWIWLEALSEIGRWTPLYCFRTQDHSRAKGTLRYILSLEQGQLPKEIASYQDFRLGDDPDRAMEDPSAATISEAEWRERGLQGSPRPPSRQDGTWAPGPVLDASEGPVGVIEDPESVPWEPAEYL